MEKNLDKSYDIQKHLTTLNTISILITIALFDNLKEHIEPSVVFKVVKFFLFSMIFSLAYLFVSVGMEGLGEEAKRPFIKLIILITAYLAILLSWGAFVYGITLIAIRFIGK